MKTTNRSLRIVGTLLTVLSVFTPCSSLWAMSETAGDFILPFDVQWNGATLPAGQYHFTLSSSGELGGVIFIRDTRQNGKLLVLAKALGKTPHRNALTIVRRQGKWYVASLALQDRTMTLEYSVPAATKADRSMEASIQVIPLRIANS